MLRYSVQSVATLSEFVEESRLKNLGEYPNDPKMISKCNLRSHLEICDTKHHDIGTNDFLTD